MSELSAQTPIFNPSSPITTFGSVSSPSGETVHKIIDGNIYTKFLDFIYSDGMGFTVDLQGVSMVANEIRITTANDESPRDPRYYQVLGSNNGSINFRQSVNSL